MATNGVEWQCVHVLPEHLPHVYGHVVGPSIYPRHLEVAVPSYLPTPNEYVKYDAPGSVLTDLPVAAEAADWFGHEHVQEGTFNNFLLRLKSGIGKHGSCLANYYRRRYIYHLQWIEYAVLLYDLPPAAHAAKFLTMVMFLAFAFAKSDDTMTREVMQLTTEQVFQRLKTALEDEMFSRRPCEYTLDLVRHVLVAAVGISHVQAPKKVPYKHIPGVAYHLMNQRVAGELRSGIDITALLEKLSGCRALSEYHIDLAFVQQVAYGLGCIHWIPTAGMPVFLVLKDLATEALSSFLPFVQELFDASNTLELHDNAERLFAIWAYREREANNELAKKLEQHANYLFAKFGQSLIDTKDPSQMALDLMAMICIARLHTASESTGTYYGPILDLHQIIKRRPYQTVTTLTYLLTGLSEALEECEEFGNVSLIKMTKLTFVSFISSSTAKRYWAYRVRKKKAHEKAFKRAYKWTENSTTLATMKGCEGGDLG